MLITSWSLSVKFHSGSNKYVVFRLFSSCLHKSCFLSRDGVLMVSSRILQLVTCCYKTFQQFDFNVFNEMMII